MKKPNRKDYHTNDGMHAAMQSWANLQNKPILKCVIVFKDNSVLTEEFKREQKAINYKTPDGETYNVLIDTGKFEEQFFNTSPTTQKELKDGYIQWLGPDVLTAQWFMV